MNKTANKLGDKLPGCLLSDKDWEALRDEVKNSDNPKDAEFRRKIINKLSSLADIYCKDENKDKCLLCGNTQKHKSGLCPLCLKAFTDRGVLRQHGHVRGSKNSDLKCLCCGKEALTMGLCRSCYYTMKRHNLQDVDELISYKRNKTKDTFKGILDKV